MSEPSSQPQLTQAQLLWRIAGIVLAFAAIGIMVFWLGNLGLAICGWVIALFWVIRKLPFGFGLALAVWLGLRR